MSQSFVRAVYWVETPYPIEFAASVLAGEQSTGTFVKVPGETADLRARFAARIESIRELEPASAPCLPGCKPPISNSAPVYRRAEIAVVFPLDNMGPSLTTLMATVAGNLFELREFSGLKLLDLDLPPEFSQHNPGPQFGIDGTRRLAGVEGRPLLGTIVKPSVGLSPVQTADLVSQLVDAEIDFIKDDELMANPPHSPLAERVAAVMPVIRRAAERTGKQAMYAFNVSDDVESMRRHHDLVLSAGGTCVMVSVNSVGLSGVRELRRTSQLPIHAHRNGWGMLTRSPGLGMEFPAYQQFWRLAGVDHLHVNGLQNKFWEPDDSVVRSIESCLKPVPTAPIVPVVSSGQWGGQAPATYQRTRTVDLLYLCGGGLMAHPLGPAAGYRAIRQAWEAAVAGIPLDKYAEEHEELRASLAKFGAPGGGK